MTTIENEKVTSEAEAYAEVMAIIEGLPHDVTDRVLRYAKESSVGSMDYLKMASQLVDTLGDVLEAVRNAIRTCKACGSTRLVDGKPCPVCFELWAILPEAEKRASLLKGDDPE